MKPCLVVVFNHRYEANLPKLRALYRDRFEHVHYLMPFYRGNEPDVSPVFDSSARFQGFFAQGQARYRQPDATHYVFVADDLLLDPKLNQDNLLPSFGVGVGGGYIKELIPVSEDTFDWPFLYIALKACRFDNFVNAQEELPSRQEAFERFAAHGLSTARLGWRNLPRIHARNLSWSLRLWLMCAALIYAKRGVRDVVYPLARAYSDFVAVPAEAIDRFCHLCAVFAAMGIFVECAIPTALVLAVDAITLEKALPRRGQEMLHAPDRAAFEERYGRRLSDLLRASLPEDALYVHPVKLSRWRTDDGGRAASGTGDG